MGWLAGLMATATRLAASAGSTGDGTSAQIPEFSNLLRDHLTSLLEFGKGMGHGALPVLAYYIRKEYRCRQRNPFAVTPVSRTRGGDSYDKEFIPMK